MTFYFRHKQHSEILHYAHSKQTKISKKKHTQPATIACLPTKVYSNESTERLSSDFLFQLRKKYTILISSLLSDLLNSALYFYIAAGTLTWIVLMDN